MKGVNEQIDLETGEIGIHSTPTVVEDVVDRRLGVPGRDDRHDPQQHERARPRVRRPDRQAGCGGSTPFQEPGEFGNDTWEKNSVAYNGNIGVWTQITVDEELGLVYLPVETPTSDFYGGHRPGNNLFAESLVAVDLKTGQRKWHFQLVHHPIWNFDNCSSAPILVDINVNGKPIKAVAHAEQAGLALRVRSRDRPAGVADRGAAGAAVRRSGREDVADAAASRPSRRPTRAISCRSPTT